MGVGGVAHSDVVSAIDGRRRGGIALDRATRERVAPIVGESLTDVRVHHDAKADHLTSAVAARAFTTGADVFFRAGEHRPGTADGDRLLTHELVHVALAARRAGRRADGRLRTGDAVERPTRSPPVPWSGARRFSPPRRPGSRGPRARLALLVVQPDDGPSGRRLTGRAQELMLREGAILQRVVPALLGRLSAQLRTGTSESLAEITLLVREELEQLCDRRKLAEIGLRKQVVMDNGSLGHGAVACGWTCIVEGDTVTDVKGITRWGLAWLTAKTLKLRDMDSDDKRITFEAAIGGAQMVWNEVKGRSVSDDGGAFVVNKATESAGVAGW